MVHCTKDIEFRSWLEVGHHVKLVIFLGSLSQLSSLSRGAAVGPSMFVLEILYPLSIVSGRKSLSRKTDGQRYWDVRDNGILSLVLDNFFTRLENTLLFKLFNISCLFYRMQFYCKNRKFFKGVKRKRIKHILNSFWKHYFLKSFDINLCKNSGIHLRFHPFSGFTLICFC